MKTRKPIPELTVARAADAYLTALAVGLVPTAKSMARNILGNYTSTQLVEFLVEAMTENAALLDVFTERQITAAARRAIARRRS